MRADSRARQATQTTGEPEGVRGEYLAAILRSQLTLKQTRHMAGGNTHPRLTPSDVHAMYIPVPEDSTLQDEIADAGAENRIEARKVKGQADESWGAAKQRFGDALLDQDLLPT